MGTIKGFASSLTLDIGFILEATTPETLPERLLGGVSIARPQMSPLDPPRVDPNAARAAEVRRQVVEHQRQLREARASSAAAPRTPPTPAAVPGKVGPEPAPEESAESADAAPSASPSASPSPSPPPPPRKALLDGAYESATSMIQPLGRFNPWAPEGRSYYFDNAEVPNVFKVRGPTYLEDGVKILAGVSSMRLVLAEWLPYPDSPLAQVSAHPDLWVQRQHVGRADRPWVLLLNLRVPSVGNAVFSWARRCDLDEDAAPPDPVFERALREFMDAPDDSYRGERFKIIPSVPDGSFIAKRAVGGKPALLCDKVATAYFRGDNFYEISVDVGSSRVARSVMGTIIGFASGLTLQLGFTIEGKKPEELPERLLGGVTIVMPQMSPLSPARVPPPDALSRGVSVT